MAQTDFRQIKRLSTISKAPPRSRMQAATELARLEAERDRLLRELSLLEARRRIAASALSDTESRAKQIHAMLDTYGPGEGARS